jgi:glutamate N-acetyltransferase/amino-acid N-acetyltransferase
MSSTFNIPLGYEFSGIHCGLKGDASREDLTLVKSDRPATAAGVYTQNLVYAAPVEVDRQRTPMADCRVVVVNSGNANACTGLPGIEDALRMVQLAGDECQCSEKQVLVMSTGVIGERLPMDKIERGIKQACETLSSNEASFLAAARGILTTDKGTKIASRRFTAGEHEICIAGFAKGAGMIGPRMATMLALVITDATLSPESAQTLLTEAVDDSFNCISVEGHMSTNDTVLLLANGAASAEPLAGDSFAAFKDRLNEVCIELARMIPDDGEGASHLITVDVTGCETRADAHRIAKTVAESNLIKTGIAGADPNWGRIVSAVGYSGIQIDPSRIDLRFNGTLLYEQGNPVPFDAAEVSRSMRENREVFIDLKVGDGSASVRFWTSDLTPDYVRFNADYHT